MRMVYQYTNQFYEGSKNKRAMLNFVSRLHWHCHFIQKLESDPSIEFRNLHLAYRGLRDEACDPVRLAAWADRTPGVILNVQRQPGANVIEVVDRIKTLLPTLRETLPNSLDIAVLTDRIWWGNIAKSLIFMPLASSIAAPRLVAALLLVIDFVAAAPLLPGAQSALTWMRRFLAPSMLAALVERLPSTQKKRFSMPEVK